MNNFYYSIPFYKYQMASDLNLGYAPLHANPDVFLRSELGNHANHEKIFEDTNGIFYINSPVVSYVIDYKQKHIFAYYNTLEAVRSTLFNLPAAVFAAYNGELLLHSSSICCNDRIIAFCAAKGTGKSTLVSFLGKEYPIFSDDTIYLSNSKLGILCYAHSNKLKLTEESCLLHTSEDRNIFHDAAKTIQNKAYINGKNIGAKAYFGKGNLPPSISAIFILHRGMYPSVKVQSVSSSNKIEKASLLLEHCVGTEYFSSKMVKQIIASATFQALLSEISFVHLYIPDSLIYLKKYYKNLLQIITERWI